MVPSATDRWGWPILPDLLVGAIVLAAAVGGLRLLLALPALVMPVALLGYFGLAATIWRYRRWAPLTPADRVTMGRAILVMLLLGLLPAADDLAGQMALPFAIALVAVMLDGLDGLVARRLACQTAAGARFDMELDAFLLLILCGWVVALDRAGAWVMLIGLWRYAYVMAGWRWSALRQTLPPSQRRRVICAIQGVGLAVLMAPGMPVSWATPIAAILLVLLSYSFMVDITQSLRRPF